MSELLYEKLFSVIPENYIDKYDNMIFGTLEDVYDRMEKNANAGYYFSERGMIKKGNVKAREIALEQCKRIWKEKDPLEIQKMILEHPYSVTCRAKMAKKTWKYEDNGRLLLYPDLTISILA
jgi:hypothetical protein